MTIIKYSPLIELEESNYRNFLLYGKSGVGKTHSIGTMDGSVLVINQEKRLSGLHAQFRGAEEDMKRFHVYNTYALDDVYESLMLLLDSMEQGDSHPKWIVMDSLSAISFAVLEKELARYKDGRQAYGEVGRKILSLIDRLCELPTNFVAICMMDSQADIENMTALCPYFPGKTLNNRVPYEFDCVYFLDKTATDKDGKSQRFFQVEGDSRALAKNCAEMQTRVEPHFGNILKLILGE